MLRLLMILFTTDEVVKRLLFHSQIRYLLLLRKHKKSSKFRKKFLLKNEIVFAKNFKQSYSLHLLKEDNHERSL